jgi:hypothetical protein
LKISFRYINARKALFLVASHLSKEAIHKMDIELSAAQWNQKTKEVRKSYPKHLEINTKLNPLFMKSKITLRLNKGLNYMLIYRNTVQLTAISCRIWINVCGVS